MYDAKGLVILTRPFGLAAILLPPEMPSGILSVGGGARST